MYLFTIECVNKNSNEFYIENKLFSKMMNAENEFQEHKKCIDSAIIDKNNHCYGLKGKESAGEKISFVKYSDNEIPYFDRHILLSISEIQCEDENSMFTQLIEEYNDRLCLQGGF